MVLNSPKSHIFLNGIRKNRFHDSNLLYTYLGMAPIVIDGHLCDFYGTKK